MYRLSLYRRAVEHWHSRLASRTLPTIRVGECIPQCPTYARHVALGSPQRTILLCAEVFAETLFSCVADRDFYARYGSSS